MKSHIIIIKGFFIKLLTTYPLFINLFYNGLILHKFINLNYIAMNLPKNVILKMLFLTFWIVHRRLKEIFKNVTDLAFYFSTNGINLFKKSSSHSVWPMIPIYFDYYPYYQFQNPNLFYVEIIPGP